MSNDRRRQGAAAAASQLEHTARIRLATPDVQWERLRCILDLSFDYYWELDSELLVSEIWHTDESERRHIRAMLLGRTRWDVGGQPVSGTWDDHRRTLERHEEFSDFIVQWTNADGEMYYLRYAGRPRFDEDGGFVGYMGITQDVTDNILRERIDRLELSVAEQLLHNEVSSASTRRVLATICDALDWRYGRFWRPRQEGEGLRLAASTLQEEWGLDDGDIWQASLIADNDASVSRIWAQDTRSDRSKPQAQLFAGNDDGGDTLIIRLPSVHEALGLLEFGLRKRIRSRDNWLPLFSRICDHISSAIERERALRLLQDSQERFSSTVELAAIGICHVDLDGRLIHVNRQLAEMLGYDKDELVGKTVRAISHQDDAEAADDFLRQLSGGEIKAFKLEKRYLRKDGKVVWVRINTVMKRSDEGKPLHHISVVEDISESKSAEARIEHLATHDSVTGLPNRALFGQILGQRIGEEADAHRDLCAVLFVDLDRFKSINDSLGHQTGDSVLKAVAHRITSGVRSTDRVARFGGDEFIVLLSDLKDAGQATAIAEQILRSLQLPVKVNGRELRVTASIGVAVYPDDGAEPQTLLRHADMAMYAAKEDGRNEVCRYNLDLGTSSIRQVTLETHLVRGLEREEFILHYQPRIDVVSGQVVGAEALMRWWNSELGTIPPVQFIPVAEECGLIIPLGRWAIHKACAQAVQWKEKSGQSVFVSVNLSPRQFRDTELIQQIWAALDSTGLPAGNLELEITETAVMANLEESVRIARSIREMGVHLALDDFGTGYSSLAQLRRIPLDALKIDRSFIRDITESTEDRAITAAVVAMAKEMNIAVVAEGVETEEQAAVLTELRCDQLQGYYFGRPNHPDELLAMLREGESVAPVGQLAG
jgi:diguanylate cyclase (GGDEF)-like protein/PAS domain S-box-containing protein